MHSIFLKLETTREVKKIILGAAVEAYICITIINLTKHRLRVTLNHSLTLF